MVFVAILSKKCVWFVCSYRIFMITNKQINAKFELYTGCKRVFTLQDRFHKTFLSQILYELWFPCSFSDFVFISIYWHTVRRCCWIDRQALGEHSSVRTTYTQTPCVYIESNVSFDGYFGITRRNHSICISIFLLFSCVVVFLSFICEIVFVIFTYNAFFHI